MHLKVIDDAHVEKKTNWDARYYTINFILTKIFLNIFFDLQLQFSHLYI